MKWNWKDEKETQLRPFFTNLIFPWTFSFFSYKKLLLMGNFIHSFCYVFFYFIFSLHQDEELALRAPWRWIPNKNFPHFSTILEAILFHLISLFRFHFNPSALPFFSFSFPILSILFLYSQLTTFQKTHSSCFSVIVRLVGVVCWS
jgi:hypothetical protein